VSITTAVSTFTRIRGFPTGLVRRFDGKTRFGTIDKITWGTTTLITNMIIGTIHCVREGEEREEKEERG
jgi:hypothetical protein